ncbi:hypothetical protein BAMBUS_05320 [Brevundimonas phage vB_BpoS-Bambus]|nr:hypothetical protein BAMBUS_05320 [Brevundimonas phage vB_BpoS-Bambus]
MKTLTLHDTARIEVRDGVTMITLGGPDAVTALQGVMVLDLDTGRPPADAAGKPYGVVAVTPSQIEVYATQDYDTYLDTVAVAGRYAVVAQTLDR